MSAPEPIVLSWSGGKDCLLMLRRVQADPRYRIAGVLTTVWAGEHRVAMHGVPVSLLRRQTEALGLDLVVTETPRFPSNAVYEAALVRAVETFRSQCVRTLAFGDLFLTEIRQYREELCRRIGMSPVFPLWGISTTMLAAEFITAGYRARICCTDGRLGREAVGVAYNTDFINGLPTGIDPCGENGEFHTWVTDGPEFSKPVTAQVVGTIEADGFCWAEWAEGHFEQDRPSRHQAAVFVGEHEG